MGKKMLAALLASTLTTMVSTTFPAFACPDTTAMCVDHFDLEQKRLSYANVTYPPSLPYAPTSMNLSHYYNAHDKSNGPSRLSVTPTQSSHLVDPLWTPFGSFPQIKTMSFPHKWNNDVTDNTKRNEDSPQIYVVKKGDTLYRIAQWFDTTVELLMTENRITDPTLLQIGQKLAIPPSYTDTLAWLEENPEKRQVEQVLNATLTAYTAGYESTGKTPSHPAYGITSSGTKVKEGRTIAVDPNVIPIGSIVYIEGVGLRRAEDTGSAIKGARIDVYIPELEEALEFGVKENVKVYVLSTDEEDDLIPPNAS